MSMARVVDAGDFYWDESTQPHTQRSLLRTTGEIIVGYVPSGAPRMRRLNNALLASGGPLAGYHLIEKPKAGAFVFERTARGLSPEFDNIKQRFMGFPGVKYVSPTFFSAATREWLVVTDDIEVSLDVRVVDPATFFSSGFAGYKDNPSMRGLFTATLSSGGGIDAVQLAAGLDSQTGVGSAKPVIYSIITPAGSPNSRRI